MARRDDKIVIRFFAIPNTNTTRGGWMPVYEENGRMRGHSYGTGYGKADAELLAQSAALEAASRYIGDWSVTVRKADDKYAKAAIARDIRHWKKKRGG